MDVRYHECNFRLLGPCLRRRLLRCRRRMPPAASASPAPPKRSTSFDLDALSTRASLMAQQLVCVSGFCQDSLCLWPICLCLWLCHSVAITADRVCLEALSRYDPACGKKRLMSSAQPVLAALFCSCSCLPLLAMLLCSC